MPSICFCLVLSFLWTMAVVHGGHDRCGGEEGDPQVQIITSVQARVQGNRPDWDADHNVFISSFGNSFEEKYRSVLDTVNMASVEGALKYVQAEVINVQDPEKPCQRRHNVNYVVFYETKIVQPRRAMTKYAHNTSVAIGYCPFVAMDSGQCAANGHGTQCDEYQDIGFCVGGEKRDQDFSAPYPDTYWFSYPNSCPTQKWGSNKTDACRQAEWGSTRTGLCPFEVNPDGVTCTFAYKILGYITLDDVVGITSMINPNTQQPFANYTEFCQNGGIEFKARVIGENRLEVEQAIPFWQNPIDRQANHQRAQTLIAKYNTLAHTKPLTEDGGQMVPLPSITSLQAANPPCFLQHAQCASAAFGCRRSLYAQVCQVCEEAASDCHKNSG